jgi:hypothetical protein
MASNTTSPCTSTLDVFCCIFYLSCTQVLERGLELLGSRPVVYRLNPKAMPRQQLLGSLNLDTREWSDGVLIEAARKVRAAGCIHQ